MTLLTTNNMSVTFGGLRAVDDVDFEVEPGQLVGLIGPNGAGQDDLHRRHHRIRADQRAHRFRRRRHLVDAGPRRARRGLGRTWQSLELFDDLTDRENLRGRRRTAVVVELPARLRAADPPAGPGRGRLRPRRARHRRPRRPLADRDQPGPAQARVAPPARSPRSRSSCAWTSPPPGSTPTESLELGRRLRRIIDAGMTIFLVDHDMGLVLNVCDYIYVIEFGAQDRRGHTGRGRSAIPTRDRGVPRLVGEPRRPGRMTDAPPRDRGPVRRLQRRRRSCATLDSARRRGRGRRAARSERRGQDHDAAHRRRRSSRSWRATSGVRRVGRRAAAAPRRPRRARPRARGPVAVLPADGRREPAARCGTRTVPTSTRRCEYFPALETADRAAGRAAVGWRAADAGDGTRADHRRRSC